MLRASSRIVPRPDNRPLPTPKSALGASKPLTPRVFHTLDALRGVAAIAVFVGHASLYNKMVDLEGWLAVDGALAVDLFFILSGIVVEHAYARKLAAGMTFGRFVCIRLIRIYPLYVLGLILGTYSYLRLSGVDEALRNVPMWTVGVLMLPWPGPSTAEFTFPLNVVAWSLFVELVVNFLYALTYRLWSIRLMCAGILIAAVGIVFFNARYGSVENGFDWASLHIALLRSLFGFLLGALFRRLYRVERIVRSPAFSLMVILASFAVFHATTFFQGPISPLGLAAFEALQLLIIPAIALAGLYAAPPQGFWPAFGFLGAVSYPLYCIHTGLVFAIAPTNNVWIACLWALVIFIFAVLADRLYDRPVRAWLTRTLA